MKLRFASLALSLIIGGLGASNLAAQTIKFNGDGELKIVQFTDVHYKYGQEPSEYSKRCIEAVLDSEKPDLVVLTGDIVVGAPVEKGWDELAQIMSSRGIPYAVTLGNHDDEADKSRSEVAQIVDDLPNVIFTPQVKGVTGYGNYSIPVFDRSGKEVSTVLYCMDSRSYSTVKGIDGYGWFAHDQVGWYIDESNKYAQKGLDSRGLAFFHIPLPEHRQAFDAKGTISNVGLRGEAECAPEINTGMFAAMVEQGDVMGITVGHDHVNNYVAYKDNIALCYGQFTGSNNTYGFDTKQNGARVFVLTEGEDGFDSYIRMMDGTIKDYASMPREAGFAVVADLHFDEAPESDQFCHVNALNSLVPKGLEKSVDFVAIVGDIFDYPCSNSLELFRRRYEKGAGDKRLKYDIYPGYGNHDVDPDGEDVRKNMELRRLTFAYQDSLLKKMDERGQFLNLHPENGDYTWNVGDVHFVQANRFFGDSLRGGSFEEWRKWIERDLKEHASNGEPVVIFQHYTFQSKSVNRWWSEESRKKMAEILAPYNVIAIFVGHDHYQGKESLGDIPVFLVNNAWPDSSGNASFAYVTVGKDKMRVTTYEWSTDGNDVRKKGDDIFVDIKREKKN